MFGVGYDDLRQRHRERVMKKTITASVAVSVLCLAVGLASTIAALHIQKQKEQIQKQSDEIKAQSDEIKNQSDRIAVFADNNRLIYADTDNGRRSLWLLSGQQRQSDCPH